MMSTVMGRPSVIFLPNWMRVMNTIRTLDETDREITTHYITQACGFTVGHSYKIIRYFLQQQWLVYTTTRAPTRKKPMQLTDEGRRVAIACSLVEDFIR